MMDFKYILSRLSVISLCAVGSYYSYDDIYKSAILFMIMVTFLLIMHPLKRRQDEDHD